MSLSDEMQAAITAATAAAVVTLRAEQDKHDAKAEPKVGSVAIKVPDFWESDAKGFFVKLEHQFALRNPPVTSDATKYSYLIQALTPAVRAELASFLDEPGTPGANYANLKNELIKVYEKSHEVRAHEVMAIHSMGDKSPEGLLRHMKKLLPDKKDQESIFFKMYWLEAMPENIRDALFERDDDIDKLAEVAEKIFRKKKAFGSQPQVFQVTEQVPELGVSAVSKNRDRRARPFRFVCSNHARYGTNTFKCLDPPNCLLRAQVVPEGTRPESSSTSTKSSRSGNARAGRQ